ncbi:MAG: large subunit ribosomal protein [Campylobacterota bacterium]|nr:large subunit ribosomal protein [Campylobacterota bacterium]
MADITDIKAILYTEKSIDLQENGVIVVQTSPKMTKNGLKEVFKEYFGINPLKVNSLRMTGKTKKFKGISGRRDNFKKFYVALPEGAQIESLAV